MAYKSRRAFTLIELLVVIGIISLMAALLFPIFQGVRRDAHRSVSASNLHQCWITLQLYSDDYELTPSQIPTWQVANKVLAGSPTCDPQDTWRTNCSESFGSPLIGSYAYSRSDEMLATGFNQMPKNDWGEEVNICPNPVLLTSIFYADSVSIPFHGAYAPFNVLPQRTLMPNRLLGVYLDGSVKTKQFGFPSGPTLIQTMGWSSVFAAQSTSHAT